MASAVTQWVLHITDLHLLARPGGRLLGVDTADSLLAVLDQALGERRADAVLVTGDVAHEPTPETYARFEALLSSRYRGPVVCLPGNHDLTAAMGDRCRWQLTLGRWSLLGFDSHVDDRAEAEFDAARFSALQDACARISTPYLLLATHHHLLPVESPWLDKDRIQCGQELVEWCVERNRLLEVPRITGVVFGHIHQPYARRHERLALLGTPSTCFQFAPRSRRFSVDRRRPGYRWLRLGPRGGLSSRVHRVEGYPLSVELPDIHP